LKNNKGGNLLRATVVKDKRQALIAEGKLTLLGMLKSTKLTMILKQR
jgi:hypothetical protein